MEPVMRSKRMKHEEIEEMNAFLSAVEREQTQTFGSVGERDTDIEDPWLDEEGD